MSTAREMIGWRTETEEVETTRDVLQAVRSFIPGPTTYYATYNDGGEAKTTAAHIRAWEAHVVGKNKQ